MIASVSPARAQDGDTSGFFRKGTLSDFVLQAAKQNGLAVLVGSTGVGILPEFPPAADRVHHFPSNGGSHFLGAADLLIPWN
jgi:hypothetical protein